MNTMTIGKVAKTVGVGVETIRFYERKGLIPEPRRGSSGYREYTEDAISRVGFIRRAKELGFTLREINDLLSLRVDPKTTCRDVKRRAEAKIHDIEDKIETLGRMKEALRRLATNCRDRRPAGDCPILEALGDRSSWMI
jgi:MerR family mercuric resistance operon transcriptional regulator